MVNIISDKWGWYGQYSSNCQGNEIKGKRETVTVGGDWGDRRTE